MKRIFLVLSVTAGLLTSGCVAVVAGAAGAGTVACTEDELECPVD